MPSYRDMKLFRQGIKDLSESLLSLGKQAEEFELRKEAKELAKLEKELKKLKIKKIKSETPGTDEYKAAQTERATYEKGIIEKRGAEERKTIETRGKEERKILREKRIAQEPKFVTESYRVDSLPINYIKEIEDMQTYFFKANDKLTREEAERKGELALKTALVSPELIAEEVIRKKAKDIGNKINKYFEDNYNMTVKDAKITGEKVLRRLIDAGVWDDKELVWQAGNPGTVGSSRELEVMLQYYKLPRSNRYMPIPIKTGRKGSLGGSGDVGDPGNAGDTVEYAPLTVREMENFKNEIKGKSPEVLREVIGKVKADPKMPKSHKDKFIRTLESELSAYEKSTIDKPKRLGQMPSRIMR